MSGKMDQMGSYTAKISTIGDRKGIWSEIWPKLMYYLKEKELLSDSRITSLIREINMFAADKKNSLFSAVNLMERYSIPDTLMHKDTACIRELLKEEKVRKLLGHDGLKVIRNNGEIKELVVKDNNIIRNIWQILEYLQGRQVVLDLLSKMISVCEEISSRQCQDIEQEKLKIKKLMEEMETSWCGLQEFVDQELEKLKTYKVKEREEEQLSEKFKHVCEQISSVDQDYKQKTSALEQFKQELLKSRCALKKFLRQDLRNLWKLWEHPILQQYGLENQFLKKGKGILKDHIRSFCSNQNPMQEEIDDVKSICEQSVRLLDPENIYFRPNLRV